MVEPLRHRQTKGAETDMPGLPPPRHFPTLPTWVPHPSTRSVKAATPAMSPAPHPRQFGAVSGPPGEAI
jgi:hypothetical protein